MSASFIRAIPQLVNTQTKGRILPPQFIALRLIARSAYKKLPEFLTKSIEYSDCSYGLQSLAICYVLFAFAFLIDSQRKTCFHFAKPTFRDMNELTITSHSLTPSNELKSKLSEAISAWLLKSASPETRAAYSRELGQFLTFVGTTADDVLSLASVRPSDVARWRDSLLDAGQSTMAVSRKLSVVRSLFGYLRAYGYAGPNPADTQYVSVPPIPRDGRTVGMDSNECRQFLDRPSSDTPTGIRDRALLAVLAYSGCRVGELCRMSIGDVKSSGGHRILEVKGKGRKERRVALHPEANERIEAWLHCLGVDVTRGPLFRPQANARDHGQSGFLDKPMTRRAVQYLVKRYLAQLGFDDNIVVHSFRVTALTTARERGADLVDLQDFAGHADPRTTLTYIRNRDRLSRSPAYVLKY